MIDCSNEECEGVVTNDFVRVFGTDDGRALACLDCATATDIKKGAAAGITTHL